jgi:hypothetical protein
LNVKKPSIYPCTKILAFIWAVEIVYINL